MYYKPLNLSKKLTCNRVRPHVGGWIVFSKGKKETLVTRFWTQTGHNWLTRCDAYIFQYLRTYTILEHTFSIFRAMPLFSIFENFVRESTISVSICFRKQRRTCKYKDWIIIYSVNKQKCARWKIENVNSRSMSNCTTTSVTLRPHKGVYKVFVHLEF